ncbi:MAG: glycosyltransferase family 4 protein [Pseudomonadota bacterium]
MTPSLCIVQILPALNSGGVERGTLEIARALVAAGHRSIVISNGGRLVEQLVAEGSEHILMPVHRKSFASLLQIRPLRRLLAELKPDIVHARSRIPAWIAWLALRRMSPETRPHFVTTVHGMYSVSFYSAIMTKGEVVIAVSDAVRQYVLQNYPSCPPERIRLIYRGADTHEFPYGMQPDAEWLSNWRAANPQLAGKTVLGFPGRLSRIKGHDTFLNLLQALKADHPDLHGLIIGGAEAAKESYASELEQRVRDLGLADSVTFTGHRNDMSRVLTQCDLVLSLRVTPEAFGRTTLEPLRLGKPVIGWDVGGVGEMLKRIFPFGAVPPGREDVLEARVRDWLAEPRHPSASTDFQLSTMCSETLAIYAQLTQPDIRAGNVDNRSSVS